MAPSPSFFTVLEGVMKNAVIRLSFLAALIIFWIISAPERFFSFTGLIVFGIFIAYCLGFESFRFWKARREK